MAGLNKVLLIGHLGRDPELKHMGNGTAVLNLSLATSKSWKDPNGQKQEKTEWHNLVAFRKPAEILAEHTKKGSKIYVEGELRTSQYEKNGEKRYRTEIVVNEFQFLDKAGERNGGGEAYDYDDDSVPF